MNSLFSLVATYFAKHLIKEYYPEIKVSEKKPVEYLVNGKRISPNWYLGYNHRVLNIPKQTSYFNDRVIEDCYWLSLAPDNDISTATVAEKQAARQYLLDRIHYMSSLN